MAAKPSAKESQQFLQLLDDYAHKISMFGIDKLPELKQQISDGMELVQRGRIDASTTWSQDGTTLLMIAARTPKLHDIALELLATGKANPGAQNSVGYTALMLACHNYVEDVALALIATGESAPYKQALNGYTALILACQSRLNAVAMAIIATGDSDPGANPSASDHVGQMTALLYACKNNMPDVAMALIATGKSRPGAQAYGGTTALIWACIYGMTDVALALIATGQSNPNAVGAYNMKQITAYKIAVENGMTDVAAQLAELKPQVRPIPLTPEWTFRKNQAGHQHIPAAMVSTIPRQSPWLIHMETFEERDYPVITLPQGTVMYSYFASALKYTTQQIAYNSATIPVNKIAPQKFFYPVPYAAEGVFGVDKFDKCFVAILPRDIRIIALCAPSPVARQTLRHPEQNPVKKPDDDLNYYNYLEATSDCHPDLCFTPELMHALNVQGYIALAVEDTISHGDMWQTVIRRSKTMNPLALRQFVYKSCLSAAKPTKDLNAEIGDLIGIHAPYDIFGVPEIVLSPFAAEAIHDAAVTPAMLKQEVDAGRGDHLNYTILNTVAAADVATYLNSIAAEFVENTQQPLFHLHRPSAAASYTHIRPMSLYSDLKLSDVDYAASYENSGTGSGTLSAFETVLYDVLRYGGEVVVGGYRIKNGRRMTRHRRRGRRQHRRRQTRRRSRKNRRGGAATSVLQSMAQQYVPTMQAKTAIQPAAKTMQTAPTPHLEMTVNHIPILWWS